MAKNLVVITSKIPNETKKRYETNFPDGKKKLKIITWNECFTV